MRKEEKHSDVLHSLEILEAIEILHRFPPDMREVCIQYMRDYLMKQLDELERKERKEA